MLTMTPMLQFLSPQHLWLLLIVPVLAGLYLAASWGLDRARLRSGSSNLNRLIKPEPAWRRHVAVGLSILSLTTLTLAFARPKTEVQVPRERATIVVAIDVSTSMEAEDVDPSRLIAAQEAAVSFVQSMPTQFNVSLVDFAASARLLVPPTTDRAAVIQRIQGLELRPGTAIGEGIYTSLDALLQVPPDPKDPDAVVPARIVLLSDGKSQSARLASDAAEDARKIEVPIYTIAYGTRDGVIESNGRRQPVPVDYPELANVSKISGGKAYRAESSDQLKEVYADISSSVGTESIDQEVTARFAGYGLAFAVLAALGLASLAARWP